MEQEILHEESADRVRRNTAETVNERLDREMRIRLRYYAGCDRAEISARIDELEREWDMERILETNASAIALTGLGIAAATRNKKWLFVPGVVLSFLMQHAVQGWCPPVPVFRRLGVRTREEIEREKYALKVLRGDFDAVRNVAAEDDFQRADEALAAVKEKEESAKLQ
jgi:hypothetical protein